MENAARSIALRVTWQGTSKLTGDNDKAVFVENEGRANVACSNDVRLNGATLLLFMCVRL